MSSCQPHLGHPVRGEHTLRLVVGPVDQGVRTVGEQHRGEVQAVHQHRGAVVEHAVTVPWGHTRSETKTAWLVLTNVHPLRVKIAMQCDYGKSSSRGTSSSFLARKCNVQELHLDWCKMLNIARFTWWFVQRYIYIFIASQIIAKTQEMKGSYYLTNRTDRLVTFLNYSTDFVPRGDVFSCVRTFPWSWQPSPD